MNVTTNLDDPNGALPNEITLRDAILTGDNGPPAPAVTFSPSVTGNIKLSDELPAIVKSFNVLGPGASTLAVSGNNNWGLFDLGNNSTSTISGLTIQNGVNGVGGGADDSSGHLNLSNDTITGNKATSGGGVYCASAGILSINKCIITLNTSTGDGVELLILVT